MPDADTARYYLRDLGYFLRDMAFDVKRESDAADASSMPEADKAFISGKLMAFHTVISLMKDQAELFGLPLADLALEGVVPDRDLLGLGEIASDE